VDVALVTGTGGPSFVTEVDVPLTASLSVRGATVHHPVWHDQRVDWSAYDVAVVRTTWDYPARRDEFVDWAARAGEVTRLWNPADVLRWNTHKSYLLELEERGAPVVPTAWLGRGDRIVLAELLAARGWDRAVVKPAVAAGSDGLLRIALDADGDPGPTAQAHLDQLLVAGDVMVQPYLPSVEQRGELSVIVVDGAVTHAVRKVPPGGEFRVQEEFGGRYAVEPPNAEVASLARWIVDATGAELLVARVDLLEDDTGTLQLAELEATEPDLYLGVVPAAAEPLAAAILARVAAPAA
jgi:glutathione synthase/RimK-type ligase-like ATP-grasp enzyme